MASILSLFGTILIDNTKANNSIDETTEKAEKSGSKIGSAFSSVAKGAVAMGTAVVAGATAIGGAAYSAAMSTAEQADYIDKLSERTGINREELQRWKHAADQSGVSIDSFKKGVKTMSSVIEKANSGNASAISSLERLGLSLDDLNGMTTEEKFNAITSALADMEDGTERNALGAELLGGAYTEMLPLLNAGSDGMKALKKEADDLGIVMSEDTVKAGVKLSDTVANIKAALGGFANQIGAAAIPIIQQFADMIIDTLPKIQGLFDSLIPVISNVFEQLVPPLFNLVQTIFPVLMSLVMAILPPIEQIMSAVLPVIINLIEQLMPFLVKIIEKVLPIAIQLIGAVLPIIEALLPLLQPILDVILAIFEPLIELLDMILPPIIDLLKKIIEKVMPPLQAIFERVADTLSGQFKGAFESIKKVVGNVKGVFEGIIDFVKSVFTGDWKGAWEAVVKIFSNVFEGIKNAFKVPINWIIDGINGFIRGLNKIKIPDWVPKIGGKGLDFKEIKRLRVGMEYVPYDDMPALLHKGERVLTASESKEYSKRLKQHDNVSSELHPVIKLEFGEKSIYIDKLNGVDKGELNSFVDLLIELIFEKLKREKVVFGQ